MSEVFDPHNVKIMEMSGDGVVDELDYKTLLMLYQDARKTADIYKSAFEDVMYQEYNSAPEATERFLQAARLQCLD